MSYKEKMQDIIKTVGTNEYYETISRKLEKRINYRYISLINIMKNKASKYDP